MMHDSENQTRLIARLVREAISDQRFETLADLTDAVKTRAARLKIQATTEAISGAYHMIASNTALVHETRRLVALEPAPPVRDVSDVEARSILEGLGVSLGGRGRPQKPRETVASGNAPADFPGLVEW